jgi:peptidoglycan-associated lipoprotein
MKVVIIACLLALSSGCASSERAPLTARQARAAEPKPLLNTSKSPQAGVVDIAPDIRKACGISEADAHFPFDSASLIQSEHPVLQQLATCFVSGPLAGRGMRLVGHADPRGGSDYNMVLGGSRADTVKAFLTLRGVPDAHIATTSRGELDARGTDERTWAEDRRVDVLLH